jgi:hypothetical protein
MVKSKVVSREMQEMIEEAKQKHKVREEVKSPNSIAQLKPYVYIVPD